MTQSQSSGFVWIHNYARLCVYMVISETQWCRWSSCMESWFIFTSWHSWSA